MRLSILILSLLLILPATAAPEIRCQDLTLRTEAVIPDTVRIEGILEEGPQLARISNSIYAYPYSFTGRHPD